MRLHLLGRFAAFSERAPGQALSIPSRKGRALLAYLAMQRQISPTREQLATLLWGDSFDRQARQSLRQSLLSLRRQLEAVAPGLLVVDGELVGFNAKLFSTDATEFQALADDGGDLDHALGLYRGEFLAGFSLDVEPFDDWVRGERARFAGIAARLLGLQAEQCDERGHGEQALRSCERLLAIDPLREDWQRLALKLTARYRGRDQAIAQAKALVALLPRELDAAPEPATAALIEDIRRGAIAPASPKPNPKPIVLAAGGLDRLGAAMPAPPVAERAAQARAANAPLEPEPTGATSDWPSKILQPWPLVALACVVALGILVSRLWLLAPTQSVSAIRGGEPATHALTAKGWAAVNRGDRLENLTEAMALFQTAHKRDGDLLDAMLGIAAVSTSLAINLFKPPPYLDQAESLLQRALHKKPDDGTVLFHSGRLHLARGQYEAALSALARALERMQVDPPQGIHLSGGKPSLAYLRAVMGHTLVRSGRATEGIAHIRHAIELRPYTPHIGKWYVFAGEAELELGQTEAALEWLLRALAVLPSGNVFVHQALAAAYALRGDDANAAKHAAELRRIVPEARITAFCKQYPARLREGLLRALELSNRNKQL